MSLLCYRYILYFSSLTFIPHLLFHKLLYDSVLSATIYPVLCFSSRLTPIYISSRGLKCLSNLLILRNLHMEPHHFCALRTKMKQKKNPSKIFCISSTEITSKQKWKKSHEHKNADPEFQVWTFLMGKAVHWSSQNQSGGILLGKKHINAFMQGRYWQIQGS